MIKKLIYNTISKLGNGDYKSIYLKIKELDSKEKLKEFQEKYLKELILHSYENVPYYHKIFNEIGITNGTTVDLTKFSKIPIQTRKWSTYYIWKWTQRIMENFE